MWQTETVFTGNSPQLCGWSSAATPNSRWPCKTQGLSQKGRFCFCQAHVGNIQKKVFLPQNISYVNMKLLKKVYFGLLLKEIWQKMVNIFLYEESKEVAVLHLRLWHHNSPYDRVMLCCMQEQRLTLYSKLTIFSRKMLTEISAIITVNSTNHFLLLKLQKLFLDISGRLNWKWSFRWNALKATIQVQQGEESNPVYFQQVKGKE